MKIKYIDDGKGKWQSHEMRISSESFDEILNHARFFGADKEEAFENLRKEIRKTVKRLFNLLEKNIDEIKESENYKEFIE